jgi:transposase
VTKQFQELSDPQWNAISPFFDLKRRRKLDLRQVVNALLYINRTGVQWRNLPPHWPHWQAVYYYFDQWKMNGVLEKVNLALNQLDRRQQGREPWPSIFCIDSQSVKLSPMIFEHRGTDAHKKVNGRKRQFLVDSAGRLWAAHVHPAQQGDGPAGLAMVPSILFLSERLEKVYGDQAYNGVFAKELISWGFTFEKASRAESAKGFVPVAKRWVVERSISWTNFFRRLVKDYEYTVSSSVAWLYLANIQVMLQRIPSAYQT